MKLVILDLDETMIHTFSENKDGTFKFDDGHFIMKRPHADRFIKFLNNNYCVGVWSAGEKSYVKFIVEEVLKIKPLFVLSREYCDKLLSDEGDVEYVKPLSKIWQRYPMFNDKNTIVIDDKDSTASCNLTNYIHIKPFEGDPKDEELLKLGKFLVNTYNIQNVKIFCSRYK